MLSMVRWFSNFLKNFDIKCKEMFFSLPFRISFLLCIFKCTLIIGLILISSFNFLTSSFVEKTRFWNHSISLSTFNHFNIMRGVSHVCRPKTSKFDIFGLDKNPCIYFSHLLMSVSWLKTIVWKTFNKFGMSRIFADWNIKHAFVSNLIKPPFFTNYQNLTIPI